MDHKIIVIGAGLAGLAAALEIEAQGESCLILDQESHLGGKLETTVFEDSYLLDRGFQVLLPSYPELERFDGLAKHLDLQFFNSGARLELASGPVVMADPLKHPLQFFQTAFGAYANWKDKLLVLKLKLDVMRGPSDKLLATSDVSTLKFLKDYGFSSSMIANFWQPFFSGIFLETKLETAAGFFCFLVRMFAQSPVAVPRRGVGELPKFLASHLKRSEVRLKTKVRSIQDKRVELDDGKVIDAKAIVSLTQGSTQPQSPGPFGLVTSLWFAAPEAPFDGPWLSLKSHARPGFINHVAVLSNVSSDYAMKGDALICVSGIAKAPDLKKIRDEAEQLYGASVRHWRLLRTDEIVRPFPLYLNRMDLDTPSQQGALLRGRLAAKDGLRQL